MRNVKSGKDVHVRLTEAMGDRLRIMAEFYQKPDSLIAADFLEEAIAGKFHSFTMAAKKISECGLTGIERDV